MAAVIENGFSSSEVHGLLELHDLGAWSWRRG
jgi:hypothetical protein